MGDIQVCPAGWLKTGEEKNLNVQYDSPQQSVREGGGDVIGGGGGVICESERKKKRRRWRRRRKRIRKRGG